MTNYRSALEPLIVTGRHEPLGDPQQLRAVEDAGLLEAMRLAVDLVGLELIEDRIKELNAAQADRRTIRIAVNMGELKELYHSRIFGEHETWAAACGYDSKTIFWRSLHKQIDCDLAQMASHLIESAVARAPAFGAKPQVLLAFARVDPVSNHQRMMLLRALPSARTAIASPRRTTS